METKIIGIVGASGFIGKELTAHLTQLGYQVRPISVRKQVPNLDDLDILINLAGENIGSGLWTKAKKRRIYDSRIEVTRLLKKALEKRERPLELFLSASAIGYGAESYTHPTDESVAKGEGFLSDVVADWEKETRDINAKRVVNGRFGWVLSWKGGLLPQMALPYYFFLGMQMGSKRRMISWIALGDLLLQMSHIINNERLDGPVNIVSPYPVTNVTFAKEVGKALNRPCWFTMPDWKIKLLMGEKGKELILRSHNIQSKKLMETGAIWKTPHLYEALMPKDGIE
ncbi:MAG: Epimerase family protein [Chlamydiia bacterium]|nr:Epimerase family protein [Chlamydiia bacterium]